MPGFFVSKSMNCKERYLPMKRKKIVVALGHKALGTTLPEQKAAVKRSAKVIADLVAAGADVVITHSNAPQVGMIHMAMNEFGKMHTDYSAAPMSVFLRHTELPHTLVSFSIIARNIIEVSASPACTSPVIHSRHGKSRLNGISRIVTMPN